MGMNPEQKQQEMNHVLKDMIRQRTQAKEDEKKLSIEEYQSTQKELYYPQGLEMF